MIWFLFGAMVGAGMAGGPSAMPPTDIPLQCFGATTREEYAGCRFGTLRLDINRFHCHPDHLREIEKKDPALFQNGYRQYCDMTWRMDFEWRQIAAWQAEMRKKSN